ncbi:hypothetical protein QAD02_022353 [Eretmocerus hayati]|uniref:Uncharacterized protein n=1 Tax=Eretmocerus hayati TaxID=131215 RepID=A0ACC2PSJ3_9HYME|nr:hypothetical protein QAD02_022353 [Eretmocerus hayati]
MLVLLRYFCSTTKEHKFPLNAPLISWGLLTALVTWAILRVSLLVSRWHHVGTPAYYRRTYFSSDCTTALLGPARVYDESSRRDCIVLVLLWYFFSTTEDLTSPLTAPLLSSGLLKYVTKALVVTVASHLYFCGTCPVLQNNLLFTCQRHGPPGKVPRVQNQSFHSI